MRIKKILNNNVITFESQNGDENIAMGKGIAFGKKKGDLVDEDIVDNIFVPDSTLKNITDMVQSIPYVYFEITSEILKYAKLILAKPINSKTNLLLADHIYGAVERAKDGVFLKTNLSWDIKRFYPEEYKIANYGLDLIKEKFEIELDESEAAFMALNIASSIGNNDSDLYEVTEIVLQIINIIRREFMVELDESSVSYYRMINHLKFFADRILTNHTYNDDNDDDLLDIIKVKYVNSYNVALKIGDFVKKNYHHDLSKEELLYLTIHIERNIYKRED